MTFEPHPLTVLRPKEAPARLTPPAVKRAILEAAGVDTLVLLPPQPDLLDLTAEQFWNLIVQEMRPAHLVEGNSFFFGKGRAGTVQKMVDWSAGTGIQVHVADAVSVVLLNLSIVRVSSSLVRWLITNGRMRDAAICLGRPYLLEGEVVSGFQRGRTIGVPTANLKTEQLVPGDGVYSGRSHIGGRTYPAAVSIGTLPTFDDGRRQIEAHLIGFSGDLYGQTLQVEVTRLASRTKAFRQRVRIEASDRKGSGGGRSQDQRQPKPGDRAGKPSEFESASLKHMMLDQPGKNRGGEGSGGFGTPKFVSRLPFFYLLTQ